VGSDSTSSRLKPAVLGLVLVLGAAAAHFGLIFAGVYRRWPVEWWAVAAIGVVIALLAFARPGAAGRVVAVLVVLLAAVFVYYTTLGTRIARPALAVAPGQQLAPFGLNTDDGRILTWPRPAGAHRATLLVLFRGVW
jgi:hypothetical protein